MSICSEREIGKRLCLWDWAVLKDLEVKSLLWSEVKLSTLWVISPGLKIMWAALLPRQVPGFHHSGGISKPLQVENSIVRLCKSQTACEPQVLGNSKGLSGIRIWQSSLWSIFIWDHDNIILKRWDHSFAESSLRKDFATFLTVKNSSLDQSKCLMGWRSNMLWLQSVLLSPKLEAFSFSGNTCHNPSHMWHIRWYFLSWSRLKIRDTTITT